MRGVVTARRTRNKVFRRFRTMRRGYRLMGWWFLVIGGFMFLTMVRIYLDPEGVITYNGVPTSDPDLKRNTLLFVSIAPITGAVLAFLPRRHFRKLFRWQLRSLPFLALWNSKRD